ncbi:MAG: dehydrogenase, partial [Muribaculaceae bacterium]|nr:dehydrogenase [Muribaculaceae bacterium]
LGGSKNGEVAYAKTMDGELVAMGTGNKYELLWKTDVGFGYEHAPCIVLENKGYIFMGSRRGWLAIVDATTHKVEANIRVGSSEVNGFEVDEAGDVYCSLIEGTIFRIKVK